MAARRAQHDVYLLRTFELGATARQQILAVMRLDPVFQELHRHGDLYGLVQEALELKGMEPAREDIVAQPSAQHGARFLALSFNRLVLCPALREAYVSTSRGCAPRLLNRLH